MSHATAVAGPVLRLTAARVAEILVIEQQGYSHPWTESILRDTFKAGTGCWGVQATDGRLLAYAFCSIAVGEAQLLNLCVAPEAQGRGLARQLMQHLLTVARDEFCTVMLLEVRRSNTIARRLYESLGFATLGVRKGYYPAANAQREDALVMAFEIT